MSRTTIDEMVNIDVDLFINKMRDGYKNAGKEFTKMDELIFRTGVEFGINSLAKAIATIGININGIRDNE